MGKVPLRAYCASHCSLFLLKPAPLWFPEHLGHVSFIANEDLNPSARRQYNHCNHNMIPAWYKWFTSMTHPRHWRRFILISKVIHYKRRERITTFRWPSASHVLCVICIDCNTRPIFTHSGPRKARRCENMNKLMLTVHTHKDPQHSVTRTNWRYIIRVNIVSTRCRVPAMFSGACSDK